MKTIDNQLGSRETETGYPGHIGCHVQCYFPNLKPPATGKFEYNLGYLFYGCPFDHGDDCAFSSFGLFVNQDCIQFSRRQCRFVHPDVGSNVFLEEHPFFGMGTLLPIPEMTQMILILGLQQFGFHSVMIRQKTNAKSARVDPMLLKKTQIQSLFAFLLPLISNCGLHTCQYCD